MKRPKPTICQNLLLYTFPFPYTVSLSPKITGFYKESHKVQFHKKNTYYFLVTAGHCSF